MKKGTLSTAILIFVFFVGLCLLLYPTVSNYWNSLHQSKAIARYADQVALLDDERYEQLWNDAFAYNQSLTHKIDRYAMSDQDREEYESILNVTGKGILGYIEIPVIGVSLPIYHGTDSTVLQSAIGHMEGSSLPTGGKGTHCVLSGHRGLPSARLFTDLDQMVEGDIFTLQILNETLTYEVDQIIIAKPSKMEYLEIDPEQDYCTLLTCTPYGVNSHRLLVRGHRVENLQDPEAVRVTADAMQIEPVVVAPLVAAPMLLFLLILLLTKTRKKKR